MKKGKVFAVGLILFGILALIFSFAVVRSHSGAGRDVGSEALPDLSIKNIARTQNGTQIVVTVHNRKKSTNPISNIGPEQPDDATVYPPIEVHLTLVYAIKKNDNSYESGETVGEGFGPSAIHVINQAIVPGGNKYVYHSVDPTKIVMVFATVDPNNAIDELNENNNSKAKIFLVL